MSRPADLKSPALDMSTRSGCRCSITLVSTSPPCSPCLSSSSSNMPSGRRREPVDGDDEHAESLSQVSRDDLRNLRLAPVTVEEDEFLDPRAPDGLADVGPRRHERVGSEADRPGEVVVLHGLAEGEGRGRVSENLGREELHGAVQDPGVDRRVDAHGKVRTVRSVAPTGNSAMTLSLSSRSNSFVVISDQFLLSEASRRLTTRTRTTKTRGDGARGGVSGGTRGRVPTPRQVPRMKRPRTWCRPRWKVPPLCQGAASSHLPARRVCHRHPPRGIKFAPRTNAKVLLRPLRRTQTGYVGVYRARARVPVAFGEIQR